MIAQEGFMLKQEGRGTDCDSASKGARKWAESVDMKVIVQTWAMTNMWRYIFVGLATLVSASATVLV